MYSLFNRGFRKTLCRSKAPTAAENPHANTGAGLSAKPSNREIFGFDLLMLLMNYSHIRIGRAKGCRDFDSSSS
jgi:hypothetical protein